LEAEDKGVGDEDETIGWFECDYNGSLVFPTPTKEHFYIMFNI